MSTQKSEKEETDVFSGVAAAGSAAVTDGSIMSGQIAGLVKKEQTCQEMIEEIMSQAEALLGGK